MVSRLMGDSTALASAIVRCCLRFLYLCYVPSRVVRLGLSFLRELIGRATVAQHIRIPNRIAVLAHGIAGVALYGIDTAILDFFHNTHMVG